MMQQRKQLTPQQALQTIKQYCAYQERCHNEVKERLFNLGMNAVEADTIISKLIEENYLNEERFAEQYAGGKFRMKQWGKQKIKSALRQKHVSDYCIKKGLKKIDDEAYMHTLNRLAEKKVKELKSERNIFIKKRKLRDYLLQKGYETELIQEVIASTLS